MLAETQTTAKERYLAELENEIAAARAQYDRLTATNNEVAASLRAQALVDARHIAAEEVAAEQGRVATKQAELDRLIDAARQDRMAAAAALAAVHASAEQLLQEKLCAAHAAAREALR